VGFGKWYRDRKQTRFSYSQSHIDCLLLQFAIGQELKNPKDLIINTFTFQNIAVVRTGSIVAATLILAATIARGYSVSNRQSIELDRPAQVSDPLLS
jgi:predicted SPOUT superfamily RNA methylase MTH1